MKIYKPKPLHLIRLTISKHEDSTFTINFIDTTQENCIKEVIKIIDSLKLSAFQTGKLTRLDFRDCIGGKNGKCKSISFKGLDPEKVYKLLLEKIELKE